MGGAGRSEDQDANDPRRDTQHAKAIDTEDITAKDDTTKDTDGSDSYPLVPRNDTHHGQHDRDLTKEGGGAGEGAGEATARGTR